MNFVTYFLDRIARPRRAGIMLALLAYVFLFAAVTPAKACEPAAFAFRSAGYGVRSFRTFSIPTNAVLIDQRFDYGNAFAFRSAGYGVPAFRQRAFVPAFTGGASAAASGGGGAASASSGGNFFGGGAAAATAR